MAGPETERKPRARFHPNGRGRYISGLLSPAPQICRPRMLHRGNMQQPIESNNQPT